jgi:hypothetical protein
MNTRTTPTPLDEELHKKLQEGLSRAFDHAISCCGNSNLNNDSRMRGAQAAAQIADALMRLQDRKPL